MSYFEELKFKETPDPNVPKKSVPVKLFNNEKLKEASRLILEEVERVKKGQSRMIAYAVNPSSFGFPATNLLSIFLTDPTEKNYKAFVEITAQDFNGTIAKYFAALVDAAREETTNE